MDDNDVFMVSIKAVVFNDEGQILLIKSDEGIWDLPGGRMQKGESLIDCLHREINEELGVAAELLNDAPLFAWKGVSDRGEPKVAIGFKAKFSSMEFKSSNENTESRFFGKKDLDNIRLQNCIESLRTWLSV